MVVSEVQVVITKQVMISLFLVFAAVLTNSFNIADSLLEEGKYKKALIEYERLDFFAPCTSWKYKKALCYRELGRYHEAVRLFESLEKDRELIKTYILMGEYRLAQYESKKIGNQELADDLSLLIDFSPQKDIRRAQILSSIVPGLGEIYAGRPWHGLFTFSLNLLSAGLAVQSFARRRYLDGILISGFLWSRFYQGGIENAAREASKYNEEKKNAYLKEIAKRYGFSAGKM